MTNKIQCQTDDKKVFQYFRNFVKQKEKTQGECFNIIINNYKTLPFEFNSDELALLEKANDFTNGSFAHRIRNHILKTANNIIEARENANQHEDKKEKNNSAIGADLRIDELVDRIIAHNDNSTKANQLHISKTSILKFAKDLKAVDDSFKVPHINIVARGVLRNQDRIDANNKKHDLDVSHNRKKRFMKD